MIVLWIYLGPYYSCQIFLLITFIRWAAAFSETLINGSLPAKKCQSPTNSTIACCFAVICCAGDVICQSREECVYMVAQANRMLALILEVVIFNDFAARVWFQAALLPVFGFCLICWNPTHRDVFPFKTSCKHVNLVACEASLNYHNTHCFTLMHAEGRNGAAFILVYFYIFVS